MGEILVSDQCERRPPLSIGGLFSSRERGQESRRAEISAGCRGSFAQPGLFFPLYSTTKNKRTGTASARHASRSALVGVGLEGAQRRQRVGPIGRRLLQQA